MRLELRLRDDALVVKVDFLPSGLHLRVRGRFRSGKLAVVIHVEPIERRIGARGRSALHAALRAAARCWRSRRRTRCIGTRALVVTRRIRRARGKGECRNESSRHQFRLERLCHGVSPRKNERRGSRSTLLFPHTAIN